MAYARLDAYLISSNNAIRQHIGEITYEPSSDRAFESVCEDIERISNERDGEWIRFVLTVGPVDE